MEREEQELARRAWVYSLSRKHRDYVLGLEALSARFDAIDAGGELDTLRAENERLRDELGKAQASARLLGHAYDTDNRPANSAIAYARSLPVNLPHLAGEPSKDTRYDKGYSDGLSDAYPCSECGYVPDFAAGEPER